MTEEDIKRIVAEKILELRPRHEDETLDNRLNAYYARYAFEEAWRMAGGDPAVSNPEKEPVGWREAWMKSDVRKRMIKAGLLTGEDNYK